MLVAFPTPVVTLFLVLGFIRTNPLGSLPSQPQRFLCFRFLGFYPPQIPQVGCLYNPPPTPHLFAFSFWGFNRHKSPGWLPYQTPALSLLSVFWIFARLQSPQVDCLPNPAWLLCQPFCISLIGVDLLVKAVECRLQVSSNRATGN